MKKILFTTTALAMAMTLPSKAEEQTDFTFRGFGGVTVGNNADDFAYQYDANTYAYEFDLDSGFVIGGAVGVAVSDFTIELEGAFRSSDADVVLDATYFGDIIEDAGFEADFDIGSVLVNAWYDVPLNSTFSVYVGGGIGVGIGRFEPGEITALPADLTAAEAEAFLEDAGGETEAGFAWQVGGGLLVNLSERVSIGAGYRYFSTDLGGTGYDDSSIIGEIRFRF